MIYYLIDRCQIAQQAWLLDLLIEKDRLQIQVKSSCILFITMSISKTKKKKIWRSNLDNTLFFPPTFIIFKNSLLYFFSFYFNTPADTKVKQYIYLYNINYYLVILHFKIWHREEIENKNILRIYCISYHLKLQCSHPIRPEILTSKSVCFRLRFRPYPFLPLHTYHVIHVCLSVWLCVTLL